MATELQTTERSMLRPWFRRGPIARLRQDLHDLLSEMSPQMGEGWLTTDFATALDVAETDKTVEVRMDAPGIKAADIDIRLNNNVLTISGEKKEEKEEKGKTYHRVERSVGTFSRSITLPCPVNEDKIDAQYRDGVLTVTLPKTEEAKTRKIQVKA
jgi:HSP20 family protein